MTNYIEICEQIKARNLDTRNWLVVIDGGVPGEPSYKVATVKGEVSWHCKYGVGPWRPWACLTIYVPWDRPLLPPPPQPTQHLPRPLDWVTWARAAYLMMLEQSRGLKTPRGEVEKLLACYPGWREP